MWQNTMYCYVSYVTNTKLWYLSLTTKQQKTFFPNNTPPPPSNQKKTSEPMNDETSVLLFLSTKSFFPYLQKTILLLDLGFECCQRQFFLFPARLEKERDFRRKTRPPLPARFRRPSFSASFCFSEAERERVECLPPPPPSPPLLLL